MKKTKTNNKDDRVSLNIYWNQLVKRKKEKIPEEEDMEAEKEDLGVEEDVEARETSASATAKIRCRS